MEIGLSDTLLAGDPRLIDHIVGEVKSQGIFDQFRKECIADVDTKPAYQNLRTRVEGSVNSFLSKQVWKPDLNKNQLRETLRKHIHDAPYLDAGVERIVDQVVNPKVYSVFTSQIEDVVYKFLGVERPKVKEKYGACGLKDLLPKDLDPVSPESDKNSLKDVSLESVDANDNLNEKQEECKDEQKLQNEETYGDKNKRSGSENGHISLEEKASDEVFKALGKTGNSLNLNTSGKSDDKLEEEEEEVSPTFEPIDIMNLNESNISNDSHLSGISELTSHRSRSPDFSNELSRDNFECSNQDSQLSKVSSDSRLSIVTDFGSSNHGLTPVHDASRDETTRDKCEANKGSKDNFKAIREFESSSKNKTVKGNFDFASKSKDTTQDYKDLKDFKSTSKSVSSKENSRDATDSGIKDKYEHKSSRERNKDGESIKSSKSTKEKTGSKDGKYYKDKSSERKKSSSHSSTKYDKHSKSKSKDKADQVKESSDKAKDISENLKDHSNKFKDEKPKEADKKDNINKEAKDLKDLYKEKIRELREKKELTEKEKLNKDKDNKITKDTKDRKDSPKDKRSSRKEHRSSSSSSSSRNLSVSHHESRSNKALEKIADGKDKRSDSKDKAKRDERRSLKDNKSHYSSKSDVSDRSDTKKASKSEKEDKTGKVDAKRDVKASGEKATNGKKDVKNHVQRSKSSERNEKSDNRKDSKSDSPSKEKKRRDDKKSKTTDDHSSLRKNSNDRRSTDRDGSNGSNSKTSPSNNSSSNATSNKSSTSNLTKENHVNNPSETSSDSIEEMQVSDMKLSHQSNCKLSQKISSQLSRDDKHHTKMETDTTDEVYDKQGEQTDSCDASLRLKKRSSEDDESTSSGDMKIKKPKFARNIHEAKKLMKIRKQMEKQKLKEERKIVQGAEQTGESGVTKADNLESVPDYERVQIIEVRDEEYEEPYPEKYEHLTLDERSIMLSAESCTNDVLERTRSNLKPTLSSMELCIKQSLSEIVSNAPLKKPLAQHSKVDENVTESQSAGDSFQQSSTSSCDASSAPRKITERDLREFREMLDDAVSKNVDAEQRYSQTDETQTQKQKAAAIPEKSASMDQDEDKSTRQLAEESAEAPRYNQAKAQDDNEAQNDDRSAAQDDNEELQDEKQRTETIPSRVEATDSSCNRVGSSSPVVSEDNEDCRYFKSDNEKSEKFYDFLQSLELVGNSSLEDIIESLGGKVVSSLPKSMAAPPLPRHKRSSSPLSDILVNNSDNNNDGHKQTLSSSPNEDTVHHVKKRKFAKKPRLSSLCNPQGISNGENFVMPLSPDSDVSATSDKTASNVIKEEKSRNRSSQRYSSDDLYKPRPLFSSSSRRSRRSNQS
ncbi:hypothetical protein DMN91_002132 [Ooceraea biroi]|uniref:Biorientation of chromosomes in cell division protein 1-like protein n=1 Tax=Ooceraea biroi TaxID=2015173 RepID=A0A026WAM0_OOCBI|nr:biorientation of chromosomes in cell division protein 1-like 1 [Ooceraea biroi]EZA52711.1 Biorientation of chromosomes in cell division protein 1-like protein [Ooceraea biroi]RLU25969.1 hypothetical protein DMN91_002132 [Ooceraea biroi]